MMHHGAPSVIAWQASEGGSPAYVSVITMNEIRYGAKKVAFRDPGFAARLADWYQEILAAKPLYTILPIGIEIAELAADYRAAYGMSLNDSLIAATASVHGLTIATRNTADLEITGVSLFNPWDFPI
jgi:predicted nucleic acid-binding protein